MKNSADMTTLSRYMYRTATSKKLSLQNAVKLLQSTAYVRTTKDILMKFSRLDPAKESELQAYVLDALLKTSDAIGRDSLRRKVSIWIKEGGAIGKDAAIQLAFAFGFRTIRQMSF